MLPFFGQDTHCKCSCQEGDPPRSGLQPQRPVCPAGLVGPVPSRFLYPFAGQCVPKSIANITAPASPEFINYASIQIVFAIPTWLSCLLTIHTAHQRKWKERGRLCEGGGLTQRPTYLSSESQCLLSSQVTDACGGTLLSWRDLKACLPTGPTE